MIILDHFGQFVVGLVAIALAAPCLLWAPLEEPPSARLPRAVVGLGVAWALAFLVAAVLVIVDLRNLAVFGLLVAAAEVLAGGAIWAARAAPADGGDDGGGGGEPGDGREPPGAPGLDVPEHYWRRWEESLRAPGGLSRR